jgi:vacuolar protein sorting-associated protein 3
MPFSARALLARRSGRHLCVADHTVYNMIDLDAASLIPLLPLSQTEDEAPVKPFIQVISDNEFLILSWTGTSTLGLFVTGDGDPVRGTLEWPNHPKAVGRLCALIRNYRPR